MSNESFIGELERDVYELARELLELDDEWAQEFARLVASEVVERFGGRSWYVPERARPSAEAVLEALGRGDDHRRILRRFGISRATLYRIQKRAESVD